MDFIIFILIAAIAILIIAVRLNSNGSVYKYISKNAGSIYDKVYDDEFMYEKFPVMRPKDA